MPLLTVISAEDLYPSQFNDAVTLDDMLLYLGEFEWYQKYLFCLLMVFCLFLTFVYFTQTFLTILPTEYWCKLPQVKGVSSERLKELMIPSSNRVPYEGHQLPYSRCWMYDLPVEKILAVNKPDENWPLKKCSNWDFKLSKSDVPYLSVAAELNWVCDENYKSSLAQSIFFVGSICGSFLFGWLADRYGRVPVLMVANMMGFIGGFCTVYVSRFWHFCICRFIVGLAYDNTFIIAYILVLEYTGPKWRTFISNIAYGIFYTLGATILPWLAHSIANWRTLASLTSIPMASIVIAPFIIPESVRWLISKRKLEKALKIITKIEKINDADVPQYVYEEFLDDCVKTADILSSQRHTILDLFRTKHMRNIMLLLMLSWGVIQMVYDGHIRCLDKLGIDIFTTFTVASATEFPAQIFITYTLDVWGRRWMLFGSMIISGFFSLCAACVPLGLAFASLAICGRFFINISLSIATQYAAELLPTVVRSKGMALIQISGFVTSVFSPFVALSNVLMYNVPMILLGTTCMFGGCISLFLPETLMEQLPQSMLDGELFGIDQTFWETPFTRRTPLKPKGHHLHAKHPASRPGMLRSSMVSGYLGNMERLTAIREKILQDALDSTESTLVSRSPSEYLAQIQKKVHSRDESRRENVKEEN